MDRTVFSDPAVVTASRDFVCIRLATYEDPEEAEFLRSLYRSPTGEDVNTVFALLTPDGEAATRAGRSPSHAFRTEEGDTVARLVREMEELHERHPGRDDGPRALPTVADLRLALNVAACELQPVLALVAEDDEALDALEHRIADELWKEALAGRFTLVSLTAEELAAHPGLPPACMEPRLLVLTADAYGLEARREAALEGRELDDLEGPLSKLLDELEPRVKDSRAHVRSGKRAGIEWETALPVTDGPKRHERD